MDTIEDLGRRAGAAALAAAAQVADADDGLRRIVDDAGPIVPSVVAPRSDRRPSRRWALVAAAAAVIGIGSAAVVIAGRDDSPRLSPDPTPTPITTVASASTSLPTDTTALSPATSSAPEPAHQTELSVSYLDPPPDLPFRTFAAVDLYDDGSLPSVAVGDDGVVVRTGTGELSAVSWSGDVRVVPAETEAWVFAAGPGEVAYGLTGDGPLGQVVAIALAGPRAGQVVASAAIDYNNGLLEQPAGMLGRGPTGVERRDDFNTDPFGLPYVDEIGEPIEVAPTPDVRTEDRSPADDSVAVELVRSTDGRRQWLVEFESHPDARPPFEGHAVATPTADGGAVIWRGIGAPVELTDFAPSTLEVIGFLHPQGTAEWYTVPEGWKVLARDIGGTVLAKEEGGLVRLAVPANDAAATFDLCATEALNIVAELVDRRIAGDGRLDCLDPVVLEGADAPPCWIECLVGSVAGVEIGDVGQLARPRPDTSVETGGFGLSLVLTYANEWGYASYRVERWQLWPAADGTLSVTAIEEAATADALAAARATIDEYLGAIADGRYDDAAAFLAGDGGTNFDERSDLAQLGATSTADVTRALQAWCETTGLHTACTRPVSIDLVPTTGLGARVTAWYEAGGRVVRGEFLVGSYEGTPTVHGIPPSWMDVGPSVALEIADGTFGAERLILHKDDGLVLVADRSAVPVDTPGTGQARIDGQYVYWTQWSNGVQRSLAFSFDGEWLCDVDGAIDHIRQRPAGGFVATVERTTGMGSETDETPVPSFAIDCATGTEEPIAPISWWFEAGSRHILEVGDEAFTVNGDAEGNATVTAADGRSITGGDIALDHDFDAAGTTITYGNVSGGSGVHETNRLVTRDTATGEVRWSVALPRVFLNVFVYGDKVAVAHPPRGDIAGSVIDSYTILDLATGQVIREWPATFMIADLG